MRSTPVFDLDFRNSQVIKGKQRRHGFVPQSPPRNGAPPAPSAANKVVDDEEKALDIAAAKEIARELDSLNSNSQPTSPLNPSHPPNDTSGPPPRTTEPTVDRGRPVERERVSGGPESTNTDTRGRSPSPLAPPSAPFAKRNVSPHPYAELNATSQIPPFGAAGTQGYGSPYHDAAGVTPDYGPTTPNHPSGNANTNNGPGGGGLSPAQAYAQSYQRQQQQQVQQQHVPINNSSLPPRFQALQHQAESTKPPRFQNQQQQGPPAGVLPPRFRDGGTGGGASAAVAGTAMGGGPPFGAGGPAVAGNAAPGPGAGGGMGGGGMGGGGGGLGIASTPYGSLGQTGSSSVSRLGAVGGMGGGESPYRVGLPTSLNRSVASLNNPQISGSPVAGGPASGGGSPILPPPAGARTISAAAFKRPQKNSPDNISLGNGGPGIGSPLGGGIGPGSGLGGGFESPLAGGLRKVLPSSPYPPGHGKEYATYQPAASGPAAALAAAAPLSSSPPEPISTSDNTNPHPNPHPMNDSQASLPLPSGIGGGSSSAAPGGPPPTVRHSILPAGTQRPPSEAPDDYQYDYINAYMGSSPQREDFSLPDPYNASTGPGPDASTNSGNLAGWGRPRLGAYSDTRASRNFDDDLR